MAITTRHLVARRVQLLAEVASRPNRPPCDSHLYRWATWRAVLDLCTSHPGYRYEDPRKWQLFKLCDFAFAQMAHHNNAYWNAHRKGVS